MGLSSCDKWLDRQPLTNITPDSYYKTSDQVGAYVINYYASQLVTPQGNCMYHDGGWPHNVNRNDDNTDSFITGRGNTNYLPGCGSRAPARCSPADTGPSVRGTS